LSCVKAAATIVTGRVCVLRFIGTSLSLGTIIQVNFSPGNLKMCFTKKTGIVIDRTMLVRLLD